MARLYVLFSVLFWAFPRCSSGLVSYALQQSPLNSLMDHVNNAVSRTNGIGEPRPFGVGMDLSSGYGTVSISFANGSQFDIAKVEGEPAYVKMLAKWSLASSQHLTPPYNNLADEWNDMPRQDRRRERKGRGLPASEDVETLSNMLKALRTATELRIGHNVDYTLAATPNLVALYREDIEDAFEYIGLKSLDNDNDLLRLFHETVAAAASNGIGLCHNYTERSSCLAESQNMPSTNVLTISYTKNSLCVERSFMHSIFFEHPYPAWPSSMDFSLGSNELNNNPDQKYYWESVKDTILRGVLANNYIRQWPSEIFLFGESAQDETFRKVLEDALIGVMGELPRIFDENPVFQTARGAAEIARRGGFDQLWPK